MEIRTEIEIEASAAEVWSVLIDFARYPEWNPFIVRLQGERAEAAALDVELSLPESNREQRYRAQVVRAEEGRELCWESQLGLKALFCQRHFFRVEALGPEKTRFVHGEDFTGWLLKPLIGRVTEAARGLVYMNQALKRRVEAVSASRTSSALSDRERR